ncbi:MAG: hypothetical protein B9J98_02585 [Candidatus Terraquivivens tikiterensis]|uniref:Uncharacterized protein n=1 Tax=Candidatus Terraquivivens tikiterensis TaxID=1980982 RepID=A0A2R7Y631_9ARCH|nr:MAG: hypothetical protein B9J98_02585 [Candidatus Terraquivivens tikiterensis]
MLSALNEKKEPSCLFKPIYSETADNGIHQGRSEDHTFRFALTGFTDLLRQELYGTGVRVLGVYPGYVDTPMIEKLRLPDSRAAKPILPERVAAAILDAVEKGKAEVIIPNPVGVKAFLILNTLSASLGDWFVKKYNLSGEF